MKQNPLKANKLKKASKPIAEDKYSSGVSGQLREARTTPLIN
ncbi:hypothetical protein [Mycolicibacterium sp. HK-90]|nr:hypothetical protein [Mycolicibacterium sp. HK-90]WKG04253.1 hypothetical protein QU592_03800 [Mycolicibacterium sp. HK-90]